MLGFSQEFLNKSKVTKIWLNFTLSDGTALEFHEDRVAFNGFIRDSSTTVDGQFTVGAAVTGKLTLNLDNTDDALSAYDFRGATVETWFGGYKPSTVTTNLHPDADIVGADQFTITGMTAEQIALFEVGGLIAFGMTDGSQDIGIAVISAVSTTSGVTTITLEDDVFTSKDAYVSVLVDEKVNAGRYYIDEYTYNGSNVTLIGYDDMSQFDVPCVDTSIVWTDAGKTIENLITDALSVTTGLSLWNASGTLPVPSGYKVTQKPSQWDTMTCHDIIAYCAQIMNCFAHIVYVDTSPGYYALKFEWYATSQLTSNQYDGGTFDTDTTPYSDGATLDGGSFNPWDTGDAVDGGTFGDRTGVHIIPSPYDLTVDTDDVMISGVTVTLSSSDNINATDDTKDYTTPLDPSGTNPPVKGEAGYVINISGNPFIETTAQAETVAAFIYSHIGGMRFRPLSASVVNDPSMEAGDVAIVTGRNENTYSCFLSHVTYTVNDATQISCDAVSGKQNLKARYSETQKTQAIIQQVLERSATNTETAMHSILSAYAASMGLYDISYQDTGGATIYQYGDHTTQAQSQIIWRLSAGALTVSSDGGQTWNAALSVEGTAVLQRLYAVGIESQELTVTNGSSTVFSANANTGTVNIGGFNVAYNAIYSGKTSLDSNDSGVFIGPSGLSVGNFRIYPSFSSEEHGTPQGTVEMGNAKLEYDWIFGTDPSNLSLSNIAGLNIDAISLEINLNSNSELLTDASFYLNIDDSTFFTMSDNDVTIRSENGDGEINLYGNLTLFGDFVHVEPV